MDFYTALTNSAISDIDDLANWLCYAKSFAD